MNPCSRYLVNYWVSLSKPHTSVTALRTGMCILACLQLLAVTFYED